MRFRLNLKVSHLLRGSVFVLLLASAVVQAQQASTTRTDPTEAAALNAVSPSSGRRRSRHGASAATRAPARPRTTPPSTRTRASTWPSSATAPTRTTPSATSPG
ncbi:hypothetical protein E2562_016872, partial [Oryza meyeriana var. granulata]